MPHEDDIRALKSELAGHVARHNPEVRSEILAQLELRGETMSAQPVAEKRAPGRPKKPKAE